MVAREQSQATNVSKPNSLHPASYRFANQKFKKTYLEAKYSLDEYEKKLEEWEDLIQKLFVKKR
jgi:hypothetical protein